MILHEKITPDALDSKGRRNSNYKRIMSAYNTLEDRFNKKHNNTYDYSKFIYLNNSTPSIIICSKHGEFEMQANNHLNGQKCPLCGRGKKRTTDDIIILMEEAHGDKYDYSKFLYNGCRKKSTIICKEHGIFEQTPFNHMQGQGCPKCGDENAKLKKANKIYQNFGDSIISAYSNQKTILYYVKINKEYYKIGLTKKSIDKRFKNDNICVDVIDFWEFDDGMLAYNIEQSVLYETRTHSIQQSCSPIKVGWTEVRSIDFYDIIKERLIYDIANK